MAAPMAAPANAPVEIVLVGLEVASGTVDPPEVDWDEIGKDVDTTDVVVKEVVRRVVDVW